MMIDLPPVYVPPLPQETVWLWYLGPEGWWWTDRFVAVDLDTVANCHRWEEE